MREHSTHRYCTVTIWTDLITYQVGESSNKQGAVDFQLQYNRWPFTLRAHKLFFLKKKKFTVIHKNKVTIQPTSGDLTLLYKTNKQSSKQARKARADPVHAVGCLVYAVQWPIARHETTKNSIMFSVHSGR